MRVLVTGAAGFLGRNVLLSMPHSWEVVALYRPGNTNFLSFVQKHLRLEAGSPVALTFKNEDKVPHNIDLTVDKDGTQTFYKQDPLPGPITDQSSTSFKVAMCFLGMTRAWTGATALMSAKANACSLSAIFLAGILPSIILQKMQSIRTVSSSRGAMSPVLR